MCDDEVRTFLDAGLTYNRMSFMKEGEEDEDEMLRTATIKKRSPQVLCLAPCPSGWLAGWLSPCLSICLVSFCGGDLVKSNT